MLRIYLLRNVLRTLLVFLSSAVHKINEIINRYSEKYKIESIQNYKVISFPILDEKKKTKEIEIKDVDNINNISKNIAKSFYIFYTKMNRSMQNSTKIKLITITIMSHYSK